MNLEQATSPKPTKTRINSIVSIVIRPAISVVLLWFLFQNVGFTLFLDLLATANVLWLVFGLLVVVLALVISAYKWQCLLSIQGIKVPLLKLFTSYLIAQFFNNFLPTNIGGDVVRIADIGRYTGKMSEATASVVGERLLAGLALGLTAVVGLALSYEVSSGFSGGVAVVVIVFAVLILLFASSRSRRLLARLAPVPLTFPLAAKIQEVTRSMATSFSNRRVIAWVMVLSFGFHGTLILLNYTIFLALGVDVPVIYCFLFTPIIMALQMLPVSVNGFGVREGAYIYFFGWVGVQSAPAMAASLLFWILVTLVSLAGGMIFALRK